jgi:hypothetical protein
MTLEAVKKMICENGICDEYTIRELIKSSGPGITKDMKMNQFVIVLKRNMTTDNIFSLVSMFLYFSKRYYFLFKNPILN